MLRKEELSKKQFACCHSIEPFQNLILRSFQSVPEKNLEVPEVHTLTLVPVLVQCATPDEGWPAHNVHIQLCHLPTPFWIKPQALKTL